MTAFTYRAGNDKTRQLALTIDCRVLSLEQYVGVQIYEAMPGLYLGAAGVTLTEPQREWLLYGLEIVSEDFFDTTDRYDVVVAVTRLDYMPETYQPEACAFAIAAWVAREHGFGYAPPSPAFDADAGRLVFPFK